MSTPNATHRPTATVTAEYIPDCGSCSLCCRLLAVPDIHKPAQVLCEWASIHGGCARQGEKGTDASLTACAQFECVWLKSQPDVGRWPRHLRPDICHVIFGPSETVGETRRLFVQVDPDHPTAWRAEAVREALNETLARGYEIEIIVNERHFAYEGS